VRDSAYHIINYKGSTHYAVGLALVRIAAAILRGQNSVLSVSTLLDGEFGINEVCLSVPCVVSEGGVKNIIRCNFSMDEQVSLTNSANILKQAIDQIKSK